MLLLMKISNVGLSDSQGLDNNALFYLKPYYKGPYSIITLAIQMLINTWSIPMPNAQHIQVSPEGMSSWSRKC